MNIKKPHQSSASHEIHSTPPLGKLVAVKKAVAIFHTFLVKRYTWVKKKLIPHGSETPQRNPEIFRKVKKLGQGAAGQVYQVEVEKKLKAYKTNPETDPETKAALQKEAAILRKLKHSNIIAPSGNPKAEKVVLIEETELDKDLEKTDYASEDAEYILVDSVEEEEAGLQMELAECSLRERIPLMGQDERLQNALQLLDAVSYLHRKKICHLDIKPDNILSKDKTAVLTDFDTAVQGKKKNSLIITQKERKHALSHTKAYAAPEVLGFLTRETPHMDGMRCDTWSLGCTIAEIITGERLFPAVYKDQNYGGFNNYKGYPYEQRLADFLQTHQQTLGPQISSILTNMLQTDPARRISVDAALKQFREIDFSQPE